MSSQPLLEGHVAPDDRDQQLATLRLQLKRLDEALRLERNKNGAIEAGVRRLRSATKPLYHALQLIHGEIDAMGVEDVSYDAPPPPASKVAAWELWKQKLPGWPAKIIDALLKHGELSSSQLVVAAQCSRKQTIYDTVSKLGRLNLVRNVGGKYSLVEL